MVLAQHFPDVPLFEYDTDVTIGTAGHLGIDILYGGPPCFAAGMLVLTDKGYTPIEDVAVGDVVLTHLGRWRTVSATMSREADNLVRVKACGITDIITTNEHPFYARAKYKTYAARKTVRSFHPPAWIPTRSLTRETFLSQVLPEGEADTRGAAFWWVVGRYLADGWRCERKRRWKNGEVHTRQTGRVLICCAHAEADALSVKLSEAGYPVRGRVSGTATRFEIGDTYLYNFLERFGRYAHGKTLPKEALCLDKEQSAALLEGYISGDGYRMTESDGQEFGITTVSESLALSMALLSQRVYGTVATVRRVPMKSTTTIQGRVVNQRDFYKVTVMSKNRESFVEGMHGWKPFRSVADGGSGTVYNLGVEEDESYCVNGAVVHNCQPASRAGKQLGQADPRWRWPEYLRIVRELRPRWFVAENPDALRSLHGGDLFTGILDASADLGYSTGWCAYGADVVGSPQRRRRIFLIGRLATGGHQRAGDVPAGDGALGDTGCQGPRRQGHALRHAAGPDGGNGPDRAAEHGMAAAPPRIPGRLAGRGPYPVLPGEPQPPGEPARSQPRQRQIVNAIRALGNAVVPDQVALVLSEIVAQDGDNGR